MKLKLFFLFIAAFLAIDHVVPEIMIIITLWLSLQRFMGIGDLNLLLLREMDRKRFLMTNVSADLQFYLMAQMVGA